MLKLTTENGRHILVAIRHIVALLPDDEMGCTVLLSGSNSYHVRETQEEILNRGLRNHRYGRPDRRQSHHC